MRHIIAFSGGKDSTALALYLTSPSQWWDKLEMDGECPRMPIKSLEYVFCDTGTELSETYDYLRKFKEYTGVELTILTAGKGKAGTPFDDVLNEYNGYLPAPHARWCTRRLKIKPYEDYIGNDPVTSYVGIRADEAWFERAKNGNRILKGRKGYISTKSTIETVYPFVEDGLEKEHIYKILDLSIGRPEYYKWRTRSGCYFCFYQRRSEWIGLLENHPELYDKAQAYEKELADGRRFTWDRNMSLEEMRKPENVKKIKKNHKRNLARAKARSAQYELFDDARDWESSEKGCNICHL